MLLGVSVGSNMFPKENIIFWTYLMHLFLFLIASMQWGYVVITTPDGVLDHEEAQRRNVGGQVLGYFH